MYKLGITSKQWVPPILLDYKNDIVSEDDYVLGSTIFVNKDTLEEVTSSSKVNKLKPDKHWQIYPISLYNNADSALPIGSVYTNFIAPNNPGHFLRYEKSNTPGSKEYSKLLYNFMESQKPKKKPMYTKEKMKSIEKGIKDSNVKLKSLEMELAKLKVSMKRQKNIDKRNNFTDPINKIYESSEKDLQTKIEKQNQIIKKLKKDLIPYKIKKI